MQVAIEIPVQIRRIANELQRAGFRSWLVGGALRDSLLGLPPKDWDLATDATPPDVQRIFPKTIPVGERFGCVAVLLDGMVVEVTTLRSEGDYQGRKPGRVDFGASIEADLARRDFTINALALDLSNAALIDPFGGETDIHEGVVRAVRAPRERFAEDPLRMLRAIRLAQHASFSVERETLRALGAMAEDLSRISRERIRMEFEAMLIPRGRMCPVPALRTLANTGLLAYISPPLDDMQGVTQDPRWHTKDVWEHTLAALMLTPADLEIRLAVLYHDTGKPRTRTVDGDHIHFYGHEEASADIALGELARLTFPAQIAEHVAALCREHMFPLEMGDKAIRRLYLRVGADLWEKLLAVKQADVRGCRVWRDSGIAFNEFHGRTQRAIAEIERGAPGGFRLAIDGDRIMGLLGIKPGPMVGQVKESLTDWVLEDPQRNQATLLEERLGVFARQERTV